MNKSITVNNQTLNCLDNSDSILDTLEKNNVNIEYQCRDGYCGACRCKLLDGEVKYFKDVIAFLNEGEILTCSATPTSNITIEI